jgi:hypothetical protein
MLAPGAFVQTLVASRYTPLLHAEIGTAEAVSASSGDAVATALAEADLVLDSVLQHFQELRIAMLDDCQSKGEQDCTGYTDAVVELVAAHLLELWAVQLVGAANVGLALGRCFPNGVR